MYIDKDTHLILDSIYFPILIIDEMGVIKFANKRYLKMGNFKLIDIQNKLLKEVRSDSRLTEVLIDGKPILNIRRELDGVEFITNLIPIIQNEKIIGAISTSIEYADLNEYRKRLNQAEEVVNELQKKIYNSLYTFSDIKGTSKTLGDSIQLAKKIAPTEATVLIQGESGTGKELFAQSIHNYSKRSKGPFVPINCASLNKDMLESELFGYSKGSFTGANLNGKTGVFINANEGTVFLDEISEIDLSVQTKLLRVFQERKIRPLGSTQEIPINVRIICSSNKDLTRLVSQNLFKSDLFYRISAFTVSVPSLRERKSDIPELTEFFLNKFSPWITLDNTFKQFLYNYEWPGNIRELQNIIEYCATITTNDQLTMDLLPNYLSQKSVINNIESIFNIDDIQPLKEFTKNMEKQYIQKCLDQFGNNADSKRKVANLLGISLATLYNKL